ncbi:hypothetical protein [Amycolatopsis sp. NPDC004378]
MTTQWEQDELAAFLRKSEQLVGNDIAILMFRASGLIGRVNTETGQLAQATGSEALNLAIGLGQLAAAVEAAC